MRITLCVRHTRPMYHHRRCMPSHSRCDTQSSSLAKATNRPIAAVHATPASQQQAPYGTYVMNRSLGNGPPTNSALPPVTATRHHSNGKIHDDSQFRTMEVTQAVGTSSSPYLAVVKQPLKHWAVCCTHLQLTSAMTMRVTSACRDMEWLLPGRSQTAQY